MKRRIVLAVVVLLVLGVGAYKLKGMNKENNVLTKETVHSFVLNKDTAKIASSENTSFENYIKLIGLSKKKIISVLAEEPTVVDEGGLEFHKTGIRVWFKDYGKGPVNQVYTDKKNVSFNGVKIGDKISSFKNVFGKVVKENTSSAYSNFEYNGIILSVYYDSKTKITFAVYVLADEGIK